MKLSVQETISHYYKFVSETGTKRITIGHMTKWVGDPFGSGKRGLERNERWHDQCVSVLKNDDYNPLWDFDLPRTSEENRLKP